jgi:hypothetical protein
VYQNTGSKNVNSPYGVEVKNKWNHTSIPPIFSQAMTGPAFTLAFVINKNQA